jgi:Putative Actinobacterial Holin-X, holin superfamily III
LIALLGLPRFSLARLAVALGLLIVAIGLAIAGFVALVDAVHLYLLRVVSAPTADLLVGLLLLLLAAILCLIAYRLTRPAKAKKIAPQGPPPPDMDAATMEALAWIRRHPGQSAVLATVIGFCAGAWPEARKVLSELTRPRR